MKTRHMKVFMLSVSLLIWTVTGCENQKQEKLVIAPTTSQPPSMQAKGEISQPEPPAPTMEQIWHVRKQKKHKEVIEKIEVFLEVKKRNEDTSGTCMFLQADSHRQLGGFMQAEELFVKAVREYPHAKYHDPNYGDIPVKPQCDVGLRLVAERDKYDFPEKSEDYTTLAWKYLDKERFDTAIFMAEACIHRFQGEARKQQAAHEKKYKRIPPKLSPKPEENKEILRQFWALYDVGTCYFIVGQAYEKQGDLAAKRDSVREACEFYDKAIKCYDEVINKYPSAQCFDPDGSWYWSVKKGAEDRNSIIKLHKRPKLPCNSPRLSQHLSANWISGDREQQQPLPLRRVIRGRLSAPDGLVGSVHEFEGNF